MNIKRAIFYLVLFLYVSFLSAEIGLSNHTTEISFGSQCCSNKSYRLREFQADSYSHNHHHHYAVMSVEDFQKVFCGATDEEILSNFELFAFENFRVYAHSLDGYNEQILSLEARIKNDKNFRKKTAYIPGFEYTFGLRGEKSGFHDFIAQQAQVIHIQQNKKLQQKALRIDDVQKLNKLERQWSSRKEFARNSIRLNDRLNALHITRVTQNNQLDRQLQKELSESRNIIAQLEKNFSHNHHVRVLSPVVHHYVAQAACESCPIIAFGLSDFCHVVTQILSHGIHILYDATCVVGTGISKGVQTFTSTEHWKDMATGMLHLGLLFVDAVGQEEDFHYAAALSKFSDKSDIMVKFSQNYCLHTQAQKDLINRCAQETYQKIKSMSWQEMLESGAEIGTTMILDTLALHALNGFTKTTSNAFMKQLQSVVENEALFAKEYAVEVAGFGKLIVEEGAEVVVESANVVSNKLVSDQNSKHFLCLMHETIDRKSMTSALIDTNFAWKATDFAPGRLQKHFNKHVVKSAEWRVNIPTTVDEYLSRARILLNSEIKDSIDGFVSKEGWVFRYNKVTNEFATAKPDGTIETLFCPANGINYWTEQVKKYK